MKSMLGRSKSSRQRGPQCSGWRNWFTAETMQRDRKNRMTFAACVGGIETAMIRWTVESLGANPFFCPCWIVSDMRNGFNRYCWSEGGNRWNLLLKGEPLTTLSQWGKKPNVAVDLGLLWENVQPSFPAQMTAIVKGLYEFMTSGLKAQNVWTNRSSFHTAVQRACCRRNWTP